MLNELLSTAGIPAYVATKYGVKTRTKLFIDKKNPTSEPKLYWREHPRLGCDLSDIKSLSRAVTPGDEQQITMLFSDLKLVIELANNADSTLAVDLYALLFELLKKAQAMDSLEKEQNTQKDTKQQNSSYQQTIALRSSILNAALKEEQLIQLCFYLRFKEAYMIVEKSMQTFRTKLVGSAFRHWINATRDANADSMAADRNRWRLHATANQDIDLQAWYHALFYQEVLVPSHCSICAFLSSIAVFSVFAAGLPPAGALLVQGRGAAGVQAELRPDRQRAHPAGGGGPGARAVLARHLLRGRSGPDVRGAGAHLAAAVHALPAAGGPGRAGDQVPAVGAAGQEAVPVQLRGGERVPDVEGQVREPGRGHERGHLGGGRHPDRRAQVVRAAEQGGAVPVGAVQRPLRGPVLRLGGRARQLAGPAARPRGQGAGRRARGHRGGGARARSPRVRVAHAVRLHRQDGRVKGVWDWAAEGERVMLFAHNEQGLGAGAARGFVGLRAKSRTN